MQQLIDDLRKLTGLNFKAGDNFYWNPATQTVVYRHSSDDDGTAAWHLLHETAHGMLGHKSYETDFELLKLESQAWHEATRLGKKFNITIDKNHIEDCLDSYRDWLHARSSCPTCSMNGLMVSQGEYSCPNCGSSWHVSSSRFCRPYRIKTTSLAKKK